MRWSCQVPAWREHGRCVAFLYDLSARTVVCGRCVALLYDLSARTVVRGRCVAFFVRFVRAHRPHCTMLGGSEHVVRTHCRVPFDCTCQMPRSHRSQSSQVGSHPPWVAVTFFCVCSHLEALSCCEVCPSISLESLSKIESLHLSHPI